MKVVLAEKPSVARDIAAFVGARSKREGFLEGKGYQVTWALGHLATLKEPHDYDPNLKRWSLATLPIVPDKFELKQVDSQSARKQFAVVRRLVRSAQQLICATDAGREGELIFRYILRLSGAQEKPFQRMWLRSLTPEAIRDAFVHLRPGREYDHLYAAARCRSESDWIVGLNATRNYTVRYGRGILWSVGRVQTPVLALIAQRDDRIRNFKSEPFWQIKTRYRDVLFVYKGDRFDQQAKAASLMAKVSGHPFVIQKVASNQEKIRPPLLYDLTALQRDMNRRFSMSSADTLKVAQSLYEQKLITYPRTDSPYLSRDMKSKIPDILKRLKQIKPDEIERLNLSALPFSDRIINDKKVSDHHAIIPSGRVSQSLISDYRKVFDVVVTRLIAAFYPYCVKEVTTVDGQSNDVPFRARGQRVVKPGWTALYPEKVADEQKPNEQDQTLPAFTVGETGSHEPHVEAGQTKPPPRYTEYALLGAMETAGKFVDDEHLKEALRERGLGTPATRAAIIETLLKRGYMVRQGKMLKVTDLGRYLVALVQDPNLKSAELTGKWEANLKKIEQGHLDSQQFMEAIVEYCRGLIRDSDSSAVDESRVGSCPRCGHEVIEGRRGFGCSAWKGGCRFVLWREYQGLSLDLSQLRQLVQRRMVLEPVDLSGRGQVVLIMSDEGDVMDIAVPNDDGQMEMRRSPRGRQTAGRGQRPRRRPPAAQTALARADFDAAQVGSCPICGQVVIEQSQAFRCRSGKDGCNFVIWKNMSGKRIGSRTVQTLLNRGKTSVLKGFQSKRGNPFEARLKVQDGQVRFEFV